jgi:hypothetical protein
MPVACFKSSAGKCLERLSEIVTTMNFYHARYNKEESFGNNVQTILFVLRVSVFVALNQRVRLKRSSVI